MTSIRSRIGACIVTYAAPESAQQLKSALLSSFDVVVVVATSPDAAQSADLALANVGYGCAANAAYSEVAYRELDWWVVANDDQTLDPDGAEQLRVRLDALDPSVGLWSFTGYSRGIAPRRPTHPDEEWSPHGALLAVRAEVFRSIGGFDPRYFLYSEEVDLWLRLPGSWSSGYEMADYVHHRGGESTGRSHGANFELGRSAGVLARRHHYVVHGLWRSWLRACSTVVHHRTPLAAGAVLIGYVVGVTAPRVERVASNQFDAASLAERSAVSALG